MKLPRILFTIFLLMAGCREEVAQNVSEREVGRVVTSLNDAGISANRKKQPDGKWMVSVPSGDLADALQILEKHRLIRIPDEPTQESSMFLSEQEQALRFERSLSRSIEETLYALDGVFDVKVHLSLPSRDPLLGGKKDSTNTGTGSVLIIASPDMLATPEEVSQLVAGASGLTSTSITVLIKSGKPLVIDRLQRNIAYKGPTEWSLIACSVLLIVFGGVLLLYKKRVTLRPMIGVVS